MPTNSQSAFPTTDQVRPTSIGSSAVSSVQPPIDPNNPAWGFGGALLVWIGSILLLAVVPLFFLIPYSLQRGLNPGAPEYVRELAELALTDRTAILLQVLALLPTHLLTFALIWALVTRFGRLPFLASIGWSWSGRLRFWQSIGLGVLLFIAGSIIAKLLGGEKPTQLEQIINSSTGARYVIAALAVFTAPFVEEFMYRGVLYSALQRIVGVFGAVFLVLTLFTVIHVPQYWPNFGVLGAVGLLSLSLTVIRAYTGRLLPCVIIHLVFNGVTSILLLIEPHLQRFGPANDRAASLVLNLLRLAWPIV